MVSAVQLTLDTGPATEQDIQQLRQLLKALWQRSLGLFWEDGEPLEPVQREAQKLRDAVEQTAMEFAIATHGQVSRRDAKLLDMVMAELNWYLSRGKSR